MNAFQALYCIASNTIPSYSTWPFGTGLHHLWSYL